MDELVYGELHGVIESKRIIAIKHKKRIKYYYMSKGMFKNFMIYFTPGIYVFLEVMSKDRFYHGYHVQNVINIKKVLSPNKNKPKIYYDISIIKSEIKKIVNYDRNKLFIDFEMSMPPYSNYRNFISEIIQVGFVLVDNSGKIISKYSSYIKPELFPVLSIRTIKFLHIKQKNIDTGIEFEEFYKKLKQIDQEYNPLIFVWGKNDELELNKLNKVHKLRDISKSMQFVDLLNLHKTYFSLKNDVGLFNAYNIYSDIDLRHQKHDALEDAIVTKKIFDYFKKVCNNELKVEFKKK